MQLREGDGALGQALEHEVVERGLSHEVDGRLDPVTGETGTRPDAD